MNPEDQFIPSIFNYCDRWCEKCEFTARCRVFADERSHALDDSDDPIGDAVNVVAQSLTEAQQMLFDHAKEMGIDLNAAMNDPELDDRLERERRTVEENEAFELAHEYALDHKIFESADSWLPQDDDRAAEKMMEILHWYHFFISAKIHRGLHGLLDVDGRENNDKLLDSQSDANGSIRVALIAIERSVLAWTYLMNESNASVIRPQIEKLEQIKLLVEQKFPHAHEFVRPGFDEIETVM